jgi:hypothetical protein
MTCVAYNFHAVAEGINTSKKDHYGSAVAALARYTRRIHLSKNARSNNSNTFFV